MAANLDRLAALLAGWEHHWHRLPPAHQRRSGSRCERRGHRRREASTGLTLPEEASETTPVSLAAPDDAAGAPE
jgi:hypothetical protein